MSGELDKAESRKEEQKTEQSGNNRTSLDLVTLSEAGAKPEKQQVQEDREKGEVESIGVATIESDGTLHLRLRSTGPGPVGDAYMIYKKGDEYYAQVLAHIGDIKPGDFKPVKPWPKEAEKK